MKCRDCEHWGWGDDEGTPVWGWCWIRTSCPDPDIERTCPAFSPKAPDIFTTLSTLQAENEKLRAELEQMAACVYYKQGGLCRLGGADPANVCVMGPCPNQVSVWDLLTEMVLCPERLPAWVRPETALPEADETVLVIASGRPVHETILDHAVLLAKWYQDDGWILDEFPSYGSPKIHFWAPIPEPPEEARP